MGARRTPAFTILSAGILWAGISASSRLSAALLKYQSDGMHAQFASPVTDEMANQTLNGEYFRKLYDDFSWNFFFPSIGAKLRITFLSSHGDDPQQWICAEWPRHELRSLIGLKKGMRRGQAHFHLKFQDLSLAHTFTLWVRRHWMRPLPAHIRSARWVWARFHHAVASHILSAWDSYLPLQTTFWLLARFKGWHWTKTPRRRWPRSKTQCSRMLLSSMLVDRYITRVTAHWQAFQIHY